MDTTSTFEKLSAEENNEITRLKRTFDYANEESLKRSMLEFQDGTRNYIAQYGAIIRTAMEENRPAYARAINGYLSKELKLRAIVVFEMAAQVVYAYPGVSIALQQLGFRIANVREYYKKNDPELGQEILQIAV